MKKILFVCHGNICRSPMAQFIMQDMVNKKGLGDKYFIDSAATTRDEISANGMGHPMDLRAKKILTDHNIPYKNHFARQLIRDDYDKFDYLVGMDEENFFDMNRITHGDRKHKEKKLLTFANSMADVDDPWYSGDFETAYQDIYRGCSAMLDDLENLRLIKVKKLH